MKYCKGCGEKMKKVTYFFLRLSVLLSLFLSTYGQNFIPFLKENHKYSIFNSADSTFTSNEEYDFSALSLSKKYIQVRKYKNDKLKTGLLDAYSGKLLFPLKYANLIHVLENDLFIVSDDDKKNYSEKLIDKNQNILFEKFSGINADKQFDSNNKSFRILQFENGIKIIDSTGKLMLSKSGIKQINYLGNNYFNFSYDKFDFDYSRPQKWGVMDLRGKIIVLPKFDIIHHEGNNIFNIRRYEKFNTIEKIALIDLKGKILIPYNGYKYLGYKNGNIIVSFYENGSILLDSKGKPIVDRIFDEKLNKFYDFDFTINPKLFKIYINNGENSVQNLIDIKGNKLIKKNYNEIFFLDQTHLLASDNNGKSDILSLKGEIKYSFSLPFYDLLLDKKLISYRETNSLIWEFVNFEGIKVDYLKLDANILYSRIANGVIVSQDSTGIRYFNFKGEELFRIFTNEMEYPSFTELEGSKEIIGLNDFSYPEKISNKFLAYDIGDLNNSSPVWFQISNKCEYSYRNKEIFKNKEIFDPPVDPDEEGSEPSKPEDEIFTAVEQQAEFPGGSSAWSEFLNKTLKYPITAQRAKVGGRVYVSFVVNMDGSVRDVQVLKGIGFGCDEEAVRIIKSVPLWKPGRQSGRAVHSRYTQPITFVFSE